MLCCPRKQPQGSKGLEPVLQVKAQHCSVQDTGAEGWAGVLRAIGVFSY